MLLTLLSLAAATAKRLRVLQEMTFLLLTLAVAWPHLKTLRLLVEGVKLHIRSRLDDISTCFSHPKGFADRELELVSKGKEHAWTWKDCSMDVCMDGLCGAS